MWSHLWLALQILNAFALDWLGSTKLQIPFSLSSGYDVDCKSVSSSGEIASVKVELAQGLKLHKYDDLLCTYIQGVSSDSITSCLVFCSNADVWPTTDCDYVVFDTPQWNIESERVVTATMEIKNNIKFDNLKLCIFPGPSRREADSVIFSQPLNGRTILQHDIKIETVASPFPLDKVGGPNYIEKRKSIFGYRATESSGGRRRAQSGTTVMVNTGLDASATPTNCDPGGDATMPCNLRSAIEYCIEDSNLSDGAYPCTVSVLTGFDIVMNPSLGPISVSDHDGYVNLRIDGNGCRVYPQTNSGGTFLNVMSMYGHFVGLSVQDISIESFGPSNPNPAVIVAYVDNPVFTRVNFSHNTGSNGGALYLTSTRNTEITDCIFYNNTGTGSAGAIYIDIDNVNLQVIRSQFLQGTAKWSAGGVYINQHNHNASFVDCIFANNVGGSSGSALYVSSDNLFLYVGNCTFTDNKVTSYDGGSIMLYFYNRNASIVDSFFDGNVGIKGSVAMLWGQNHDFLFARNTVLNSHAVGSGTLYFLDENRNAVVEDCVFMNNSVGGDGGAIYMDQTYHLTIRNCDFKNNSAIERAGAICVNSFSEYVTISNCSFESNFSPNGGAIYVGDYNDDLKIDDCKFHGNLADKNGGAVRIVGKVYRPIVSRCNFTENVAIWNGGGMYVDSYVINLMIRECLFAGNRATQYNGGAIYSSSSNDRLILQRTMLVNNQAGGMGGAIYIYIYTDFILIEECVFTGNQALTSGGALTLYTSSRLGNVSKCQFTNNSAGAFGGALFMYGTHEYLTVADTLFESNRARQDGGAVYMDSGDEHISFLSSQFINNSAIQGGAFGANYENYNIKFDKCDFVSNRALDYGGGIFMLTQNEDFHVSDSRFDDNRAEGDGGGIYLGVGNRDSIIVNTTFTRNYALGDGGAIFLKDENDHLEITYCALSHNKAGNNAGGLAMRSANYFVSISHTTWTSHSSVEGAGGTIYGAFDNSGMVIKNSTFTSSIAGSYGGVMYFGSNHEGVHILATALSYSRAYKGGGVYISQFSQNFAFYDVNFTFNYADETGGGLFVGGDGTTLVECDISINYAYEGGGMYITGEGVHIDKTVFTENEAATDGGAVRLVGSRGLVMTWSSLTKNIGENGGGISFNSCKGVSVSNCSFIRNEGVAGGGWFDMLSEVILADSNVFTENLAALGGATFSFRASISFIRSTQVIGSNSTLSGGGSYIAECDDFSLQNTTYAFNQAASGDGSAVWASGASLSITDCVFIGNKSPQGGGAVTWSYSSGMGEPIGLRDPDNIFEDNTALYGSNWATEGMQIIAANDNYNVTDFTTPVPRIEVSMKDFYRQTVLSESTNVLQLFVLSQYVVDTTKCFDGSGYISGGIVATFANGVAEFDTLEAYCAPGYAFGLNVSTYTTNGGQNSFQDTIGIGFRSCLRGEYYHDKICTSCEEGSFSLRDNSDLSVTTCDHCPNGAKSCWGDSIELKEGYWRVSSDATTVQECPYGKDSCVGGTGSGDELCGTGYEGPLCTVCSVDYFFDNSLQSCSKCTDTSWADPLTVTALCVVVLVGMAVIYVYFYVRDKRGENRSVFATLAYVLIAVKLIPPNSTHHEARILFRQFSSRLKVYITVYQIISMLPFVLQLQFPPSGVSIMSVLNVLNLNFTSHSAFSCSSPTDFDFVDILVMRSSFPVIVVCAMLLAQQVHVRWRFTLPEDVPIITASYFKAFLLFTILILPGVSTVIFATFSCHDVDPDDSSSGSDLYLRTDYRVSCTSERYHFAFFWAIGCIVVYPIGLPLYYFYILYSAKHAIMYRDNPSPSKEGDTRRSSQLRPLIPLFQTYKPHLWFFELVDITHRLFLTGVLTVIAQGSAAQVLVGYIMIIFFKKIYEYVRPYEDPAISQLKEVTMWQVYAILLMALLIRLDFVEFDNPVLAIFLALAMFGSVIYEVLRMIASKVWDSERISEHWMTHSHNSIELDEASNPVIVAPAMQVQVSLDLKSHSKRETSVESEHDDTRKPHQAPQYNDQESDEEFIPASVGGRSAFDISLDGV